MGFKIGKWRYSGDVNREEYGGQDYRQIAPKVWQFIDLTNMVEAVGERDNEGHPKYVIELSHVDLNRIPEKEQKQAIQSCGDDRSENTSEEEIAWCCFSYGCKAPMGSWEGNGWTRPLREARAEAKILATDAQRLAEKMAQPVNKIGSTAEEYMRGDINAALTRAQGPEADLMRKIHSAPFVVLRQSDLAACLFLGGQVLLTPQEQAAIDVLIERISTLEDVAAEYKALRDRPEEFRMRYIGEDRGE